MGFDYFYIEFLLCTMELSVSTGVTVIETCVIGFRGGAFIYICVNGDCVG